jgi:hypothetical protein
MFPKDDSEDTAMPGDFDEQETRQIRECVELVGKSDGEDQIDEAVTAVIAHESFPETINLDDEGIEAKVRKVVAGFYDVAKSRGKLK